MHPEESQPDLGRDGVQDRQLAVGEESTCQQREGRASEIAGFHFPRLEDPGNLMSRFVCAYGTGACSGLLSCIPYHARPKSGRYLCVKWVGHQKTKAPERTSEVCLLTQEPVDLTSSLAGSFHSRVCFFWFGRFEGKQRTYYPFRGVPLLRHTQITHCSSDAEVMLLLLLLLLFLLRLTPSFGNGFGVGKHVIFRSLHCAKGNQRGNQGGPWLGPKKGGKTSVFF